MKTKICLQFTLFAIAILMMAPGCIREEVCDCPSGTDIFTFDLSFSVLQTRALTTEPGDDDGSFNENVIHTLDVFFYQGETLKWHIGNGNLTYNSSTQKTTVPVTADKRPLFNGAVAYDVYVVSNNTAGLSSIAEGSDNLAALKSLIFQTAHFVSKGGGEPQSSFVMDGVITGQNINLNNPDLGTVNLKRAASKIRLRLVEVAVPEYDHVAGAATARLVHFTDRSALMEGGTAFAPGGSDWMDTGSRSVSSAVGITGAKTTSAPFYAYANDWKTDKTKETYIELFIPLKKTGDPNAVTETFRYRVPLTPKNLTGDDAQYMDNLQRNLLYDIAVSVKILGSREDPPVEVSGNYIIKDWATQQILVDIKGSHYLVVSETQVTLPNISSYILNFNSSIPNATLVPNSLKASYTYVNFSTGQPTTTPITSGAQFPSVTVQGGVASGTITITSAIPVNYIPKDIEFQVTNGPLSEKVIIRQLPATYFTTEKGNRSNLRSQLEPDHKNPYMYAITTLAPAGSIIWGFPPVDANGNTTNSAEVANMVSPKFMMASQMGATSPMSYNAGVSNCQDYWEETTKNGVTVRYDDWRLPTEAEIKYIDDLQHDGNNPQGVVMRGNYYWDAYSANNAYPMKNPITSTATSASAHVRCIRDIKN